MNWHNFIGHALFVVSVLLTATIVLRNAWARINAH